MAVYRRRNLTPKGIKIKKKLAQMNMTNKEFCEKHGFNTSRFAACLRCTEYHQNLLDEVCEILNIK